MLHTAAKTALEDDNFSRYLYRTSVLPRVADIDAALSTHGEYAGLRDGESEIGNWAGERRTTAPPGRCGRRRKNGPGDILGVQDSSPDGNATSDGPGQPATTSRAAADESPT